MDTTTQFDINRKVVHEVFEDEIVVINLDNGNYYTLAQISTDIWDLVGKGASVGDVVQGIEARYDGPHDAIETGVTAFLSQLITEDLIRPGTPTASIATTDLTGNPHATRPPFETPGLQKYMDMQALLVLDPIHEVDEMGWPSAKP